MTFTSTIQAVTWIRDHYRSGQLSLNPPFQRKPVWVDVQKCYLVESILLNLPIPEIYIQAVPPADGDPEGQQEYKVVDGQQRVRAVLQYLGFERDEAEQDFNRFALDKLADASSPFFGKSFTELETTDRQKFLAYNFSVKMLYTPDEEEVKDTFRRLNKYLTPLNAQELRNATYGGPFVQLVNKLAEKPYWAENRIVSPALIRRMKDVEFVSDLLIGVIMGPQSADANTLNEYYRQFEEFQEEFPDQPDAEDRFDRSLRTVRRLFPNLKGRRWGNRTDFYSLFCVISELLRDHELSETQVSVLANVLNEFAGQVNERLKDETVNASEDIVKYVRAAEKGSSDRTRRLDRHEVLLNLVKPLFTLTAGQAEPPAEEGADNIESDDDLTDDSDLLQSDID